MEKFVMGKWQNSNVPPMSGNAYDYAKEYGPIIWSHFRDQIEPKIEREDFINAVRLILIFSFVTYFYVKLRQGAICWFEKRCGSPDGVKV